MFNVIAFEITGDGVAELGEGGTDAIRQPIICSRPGRQQSRWVAAAAARKARRSIGICFPKSDYFPGLDRNPALVQRLGCAFQY